MFELLEVNFYGSPITILNPEEGRPYVMLDEILGNLGLPADAVIDPERYSIEIVEGRSICPLMTLNAVLLSLSSDDVDEQFRGDLKIYQAECMVALYDYWTRGVAINRREVPSQINSKFKDERALSRPALTRAAAAYAKTSNSDPDMIFDKALGTCYEIAGIDPLGEYETLSGGDAFALAFIEKTYANTLKHCASWQSLPEDVDAYAREHVGKHLSKVGTEMFRLADAMPASLYS